MKRYFANNLTYANAEEQWSCRLLLKPLMPTWAIVQIDRLYPPDVIEVEYPRARKPAHFKLISADPESFKTIYLLSDKPIEDTDQHRYSRYHLKQERSPYAKQKTAAS